MSLTLERLVAWNLMFVAVLVFGWIVYGALAGLPINVYCMGFRILDLRRSLEYRLRHRGTTGAISGPGLSDQLRSNCLERLAINDANPAKQEPTQMIPMHSRGLRAVENDGCRVQYVISNVLPAGYGGFPGSPAPV